MRQYPVTPEKQKALAEWLTSLNIKASDLEEKFVIGSGKGGQAVQKNSQLRLA